MCSLIDTAHLFESAIAEKETTTVFTPSQPVLHLYECLDCSRETLNLRCVPCQRDLDEFEDRSLAQHGYCGYCDGKPLEDAMRAEDGDWTPCTKHHSRIARLAAADAQRSFTTHSGAYANRPTE